MYFSKSFLKELFYQMQMLCKNKNDGTTFFSALKYFFAMDEFTKRHNRPLDNNNNSDKELFCEYVGDFVCLNPTTYLHTQNFSTKFKAEKGYHVSGNFFSAPGIGLKAKDMNIPMHYPQKSPLIVINKNLFSIKNDAYEVLATSYLEITPSVSTLLFLWFSRFVNFSSRETIYNDCYNFIAEKFTDNLLTTLNWNNSDIQNSIKDILEKQNYVKEPSYFMESDFITIDTNQKNLNIPYPHNRIIFGAPGTGKSHQLEIDRNDNFSDDCYERVTFHPNYTYAHFVGSYKPKMKSKPSNPSEKEIVYEFVPGPFLRIYEKAKKEPEKNFLLLIEEINRANVAAVFGDVFQLLDRFGKNGDRNGKNAFCSEYPIDLPEDIKQRFSDADKLKNETKLSIPSNMYIWATMNSADQGVFPMDTAFKRRWEFEYIGINKNSGKLVYEDGQRIVVPISNGNKSEANESKDLKYTLVEWDKFRREINNKLSAIQSVNEDKWLGPFFIGLEKLRSAKDEPQNFIKLFKSKVLMYLYEDVVKLNPTKLFVGCGDHPKYSTICEKFDEIGVKIFGITWEQVGGLENSDQIGV